MKREIVNLKMNAVLLLFTSLVMLVPACQTRKVVNGHASTIRAGDTVVVKLSGSPKPIDSETLSRTVNKDGTMSMPEIGEVEVTDKAESELERELLRRYRKDYPGLKIVVDHSTPWIFVLGEVRSPGRYRHWEGMTAAEAIAKADGCTAFGQKKEIRVRHANGKQFTVNLKQALEHPKRDHEIFPNDRIFVPRRF